MNIRIDDEPCGQISTTFSNENYERRVLVLNPHRKEEDECKSVYCCFESIDTGRKKGRKAFAFKSKQIVESLIVPREIKDRHWDTTSSLVVVDAICSVVMYAELNASPDEPVHSPLQMVRRVLENQTQDKF